jgi:amidase
MSVGFVLLTRGTSLYIFSDVKSLDIFRDLGAHVIDPVDFPSAHELKQSKAEDIVLTVDFKPALNKYLAALVEVPTGVRSLADVIKFNLAHADVELPAPCYTDQSQFVTLYAFHRWC